MKNGIALPQCCIESTFHNFLTRNRTNFHITCDQNAKQEKEYVLWLIKLPNRSALRGVFCIEIEKISVQMLMNTKCD